MNTWSLEFTLWDNISNQRIPVGIHHFREAIVPTPRQAIMRTIAEDMPPEPSTRDLSMAKRWLKQCQNNHQICQPIAGAEFDWPTRLIHLWRDNAVTKARLVDCKETNLAVPYVSLSHCWGGGAVFTLELRHLSQFKRYIPLDRVAQTFRDAFEIVLQLGFSYIWIDSLCIIQDSTADWQAECRRMAGVYANAALTIAATASTSSETGLFFRKRAHQPEMLRVYVNIGHPRRGIVGDYYLVHEHAWSVRVDYAPLNQRGWVLQERFFSSRILHFGKDQLLWECQELQAAESISSLSLWPLRSNLREGYRSYRSLFPQFDRSGSGSASSTPTQYEVQSAKRAWDKIVEAYTQAKLTFSSDRLPAIAGIIAHFEIFLNDQCDQGLWRKDLYDDLLWYRTFGDSPRPGMPRAPSYTWACLDCPVAYERLQSEDEALIPCARIVGFEPNRHIRIVARLPRVRLKDTLRKVSRFNMDLTANKNTYPAQAQFDAKAADLADSLESRKGVRVYLLCMYAVTYELPTRSGGNVKRGESFGLLLKKESASGHYSRVGRFVADGEVWNEFHPRDDAPNGYYTITLI